MLLNRCLWSAVICLSSACSEPQPDTRIISGSPREIPIDSIFPAASAFVFAEPPSNPLGWPFRGFVDGESRLIVGDMRMRDVKMYTAEGELLGIIGRRGRGPGEYIGPLSVTEDLTGGDILVSDLITSRLLRFSSPSDSNVVTTTLQPPVSLKYVIALPGNRLLVAGSPDNARTGQPMAGEIVTRDGTTEAQLIPLPLRLVGKAMSGSALSGVVALSGSTILGLLDGGNVVYRYDFKGSLLDSLIIPPSLRTPVVLPENSEFKGGMQEQAKLLGSMQWITSIFPIAPNRFVLQFQDSVTSELGIVRHFLVVEDGPTPTARVSDQCECSILLSDGDSLLFINDGAAPPYRGTWRHVN